MEKVKNSLRQLRHSFYLPTLLAIVCFIVIVLLLFNTRLFRSFYRSLENDVYAMARAQAQSQSENLSARLTEFVNLSAKIVSDGQLTHAAFSRSHYLARAAMADYDLSAYKYDDLILYYPGEEYLLTLSGTCRAEVAFPETDDPLGLLRAVERTTAPAVLSTAAFGADMSRSGLVFVYPNNGRSFVLFVLSYDTLREMLGAGDGNLHAITGADGALLYSDAAGLSAGELRGVVDEPAADGEISTVSLGGASYLRVGVSLPYGIRVFTLNQIVGQFDELNRITGTNVACCVAVVALGLIVLGVSIRHGYLPIARLAQSAKRLIDPSGDCPPDSDIDAIRQMFLQYGKLSQEYDRDIHMFTTEQMKNLFILRALNGRYNSGEESDNICRHLGVAFPFPHYCACALLFDGGEEESPLSDIVTGEFAAYFCQTEDRCSALGIVNCADPERLSEIGSAILRRLGERNPAAAPTVAVGRAYDALQRLPVSYIEARAAMDYRLVFGLHTVIVYDQIDQNWGEAAAYPRRELDAFANGLLNWDVADIQAQLSAIVRRIRAGKLSLQQVKCVCMELSTLFMREVHNVSSANALDTEKFDIFHICEYDSLDELVQHISELSASIRQYLESGEMLCRDSDIHRCLALIDDHFEDCQFSLERLYDSFTISPQTLRRRFKNATGKTMNDYLTSLRLNKAKELLATTSLSLTSVCLQCGYADQSSFSRAFKAREGKTPGKYREAVRRAAGG